MKNSWCHPIVRRFLALLLGLLATGALAGDLTADFTAANELYAQGKFADAARAYEKMIQTNGESPVLLCNYGNAEFKAGNLGNAIAAYRRAELLAPRDPELRANLAFVRTQVQGVTAREGKWQKWAGLLTLNEGTLLTAACFWVLFGLLIARQIKPALAVKFGTVTRVAATATVLSAAILAMQAASHFNTAVAVVTRPEATARNSPFDDAQSTFTAHDGAELRVLDRHDDWVQGENGGGKIGWLNRKQVEVLPGA